MKRKLSKSDQEKIDEYFTGIRQVEKGLERQAQWANIPKPTVFSAPTNSQLHAKQQKVFQREPEARLITANSPVSDTLFRAR